MRVLLRAIYPYIYMLLFLTIPFDNYVRALPNILLIALLALFPFVLNRKDLFKIRKGPAIVFLLFLLYLLLNSLFFERIAEDIVVIKKIALAFGLAILYIPVEDSRKIGMAIIFSSLAAIVFSVIKIIVIINISEDIALGYSREVIEALLIDRLYLGLLSILSILVSVRSMSKEYHPNNQYHLINIIVNILFVFLMVSKIAIIILAAVFILRMLYSRYKLAKVLAIAVSGICIAVLVVAYSNLKQDGNAAENGDRMESSFLQNTVTWELRTTVWRCATEVANSEGLLLDGLGIKKTKELLVACYDETIEGNWKRNRYMAMEYNSHNQFMDTYLSFGLFALILFIGFLAVTFLKNIRHYFSMAMLVGMIGYLMVENVFHRQIGAYYIGFMLIVLLSSNFINGNNEQKEG
ncbi:O-antigen ligase family protein [Aureitalea sp. L0-47]|uniref:O-antigen ligase family protein n=1 Tax=Aureitalea sp. L0-47 TaxID=2816962 RepID=UPI00223846C1|nr:O-antigen ligase family protein [Aureitalea sp. L0-47]MCW5519958.1 O-antigen ligase family protein [Aureitalea sp. L0-47]